MTGPIRSTGKARATNEVQSAQPQPPRPPNAWILYRSDKLKVLPEAPGQRSRAQADVSKLVSEMWRNESEAVKLEYERLADAKKAEHQRQYPDYRFQPMKKEEKERIREEKRQKKEQARAQKKGRGRTNAVAGPSQGPQQPEPMPPMAYAPPYVLPAAVPVQPASFYMPAPQYAMFNPEMQYGTAGPSPPMSAASSPRPSASESPSLSDDLLLQQPPRGLPSFPQHPQHAYGMQPMVVQQPQAAHAQWQHPQEHILPQPHAEQPQWDAPQEQLLPQAPAPEWNDYGTSQGQFNYQPEDYLNFEVPEANDMGSMDNLSIASLHAMLSSTDQNGVFNMGNINAEDILAQPEGELEIQLAPHPDAQSQEIEDFYKGFDITEALAAATQGSQLDAGTSSGIVYPADTVANTDASLNDLASLFQAPHNPELQTYMAAQQRQTSGFTRDMLDFINFEAGEGGSQNAPAPQVRAPPPPAPQSPIFTQMTNTAAVPQSGYVPPAGAAHSSTRRVGASWKPSFVIPGDSIDPAQTWNVPSRQ